MELLLWLGRLWDLGILVAPLNHYVVYSEASSARAFQTAPPGSVGGILRSKRHKPTDPYSGRKTNRWDAAIIPA